MSGYDLNPAAPRARAAQEAYAARSAAVDLPDMRLDVAYGPDPLQRYDAFPAGRKSPALIFFRGGCWRVGGKETRRFPAVAWAPLAVCWITVSYRLCPDTPLEGLAEDACAALRHIADQAHDLGVDPARLHLTGNSAGAHLAALAARRAGVDLASLSLLSGLYDLAPLLHTAAQSWLRLDPARARALSPLHHLPPPPLPMLVARGGDETTAFKAQSSNFARAVRAQGNPVREVDCPGLDHFEVIGDYARPDSTMFEGIHRQIFSG